MQRGVSSDTLCEELAAKEFQHMTPEYEKILYFLLFFCVIYLWLGLVCSTSPPSGNQVDGLPLAASTRAVYLDGQAQKNICMTKDRFFMNFSGFLCHIVARPSAHLDIMCILPHAKGRVK